MIFFCLIYLWKICIYSTLSNSEHTTQDATGMQYWIPPTVLISSSLSSLFMKKQTKTPILNSFHHFKKKIDLLYSHTFQDFGI